MAVKAKRKHLIPDILFAGADLSVCTDVTVLLGEAKSRLQCAKPVEKAHMRLRKACKTREREKKRKYDESCKQMDAKFEPFVVESHGFLAAGAVQLLDQLAGYGAEVLCLPFPELKGHLVQPTDPMPPPPPQCRPATLPPLAHRLRLCLYFACCCFPARALPL